MASRDLALIVNPGANRGRSGELIERVEEILRGRNAAYRLTRTESYEEISALAPPAIRRNLAAWLFRMYGRGMIDLADEE